MPKGGASEDDDDSLFPPPPPPPLILPRVFAPLDESILAHNMRCFLQQWSSVWPAKRVAGELHWSLDDFYQWLLTGSRIASDRQTRCLAVSAWFKRQEGPLPQCSYLGQGESGQCTAPGIHHSNRRRIAEYYCEQHRCKGVHRTEGPRKMINGRMKCNACQRTGKRISSLPMVAVAVADVVEEEEEGMDQGLLAPLDTNSPPLVSSSKRKRVDNDDTKQPMRPRKRRAFNNKENILQSFLDEQCMLDPNGRVTMRDLCDVFKEHEQWQDEETAKMGHHHLLEANALLPQESLANPSGENEQWLACDPWIVCEKVG